MESLCCERIFVGACDGFPDTHAKGGGSTPRYARNAGFRWNKKTGGGPGAKWSCGN